MKNLTDSELNTAARKHDNLHNEGADGYNPYRDEIRRRKIEAAQSQPRTRDRIIRDLERYDSNIARESGTYDKAKVDALNAELAAMDKAADDAFAAVWTVEVTIARRAAWNAGIMSLPKASGKISTRDMQDHIVRSGHTLDDLRRAVKLHGFA
jgi:hypothetical protein